MSKSDSGELARQSLDEGYQAVTLELGKSYEALQRENARLRAAIRELDWHNPLHHDFDAYCHHLAQWGLGKIDERPAPDKYGLSFLVPKDEDIDIE